MLDHSCQVQRHTLAERGLDLYETPGVAVEALRRVESISQRVWEPAAGRGAIARVLRDHGHAVIASDIRDYGFPLHFCRDFLTETAMPPGCETIVTNPPFNVVESFVDKALELGPLVILLLRLAFLESERRSGILEGRGLARVHVFRKRLPMMHRDLWEGRKANSGMAFAWFVWSRNHTGPTTISRVSWDREEKCTTNSADKVPAAAACNRAAAGESTAQKEATMADEVKKPKLEVVNDAPDPFDLKSLELSQDFIETAGARKLLTTVPVKKPSPQDFVRVHPSPDYRRNLLMLNLKDDDEFYVVRPELADALNGETVRKTVHTTVNRQGVVSLWPITLPMPDGKDLAWWRSEREAAELAMSRWIRIKANRSLGANEIVEAPGVTVEPQWPELGFQELVRIAFRDLIIDKLDHPVIKRLRGLA